MKNGEGKDAAQCFASGEPKAEKKKEAGVSGLKQRGTFTRSVAGTGGGRCCIRREGIKNRQNRLQGWDKEGQEQNGPNRGGKKYCCKGHQGLRK